MYEWGFLGDKENDFDYPSGGFSKAHTFSDPESIIALRCTTSCVLVLTREGIVYTRGEIWQSTSIIFSSESFAPLSFGQKTAIDYIPDFAKKFMEERMEENK